MSEMGFESDFGSVTDGFGGYVPVDEVVGQVIAGNDPVLNEIDETFDWIQEDPSRGWVGDYPATDPVHGDLGPLLGETGRFGDILHGVLTDPNAPLSPEEEEFLQTQLERDGYYNVVFGGIQGGIDVQNGAIEDLRRFYEDKGLFDLEGETWHLLNGNASTGDGWFSAPGSYLPTYPLMPWPAY